MKLELKYLAPYLPHKLMGKTEEYQSIDKLLGIYGTDGHSLTLCHQLKSNNTVDYGCKIEDFKPILRPLSDLTKVIPFPNGIKFCPASILFSVDDNELRDFGDFGIVPEYWKESSKINPRYYDYWQTEMLFEWHFDVFGLIPQGLAFDINTLKP